MDAEANSSNFPLPEAFLDFLNQNGIDPSIYAASDSIPRYIRYPFSLSLSMCVCVFMYNDQYSVCSVYAFMCKN